MKIAAVLFVVVCLWVLGYALCRMAVDNTEPAPKENDDEHR